MIFKKIVILALCSFFILMGSIGNANIDNVITKDAFVVAQVINDLNSNLSEDYLYELSSSIIDLTDKYNIPKEIVIAIINQESNFNATAYNRSGATGLGQIIPYWWMNKFNFKKQDLWNWKFNLETTIKIINEMRINWGYKQDWIGYYNTAEPYQRSRYYNSIKKRMKYIAYLIDKYEKSYDDLFNIDS